VPKLNPETVVTRRFRAELECRGAYCIKLSDQFTRGIPDLLVVTPKGVMLIEMKVDHRASKMTRSTYQLLGLTGLQDQRIRDICKRVDGGAWLVTDIPKGGKLMLWMPNDKIDAMDYTCAAEGDTIYRLLFP
jgi:hypothetical protein